MLEVIYDSVVYYHLYLQIIPAFIGFFYIKKLDVKYRYFVLLLWYGVFNEIFALYYGRYIVIQKNAVFYNVYNVIYFSFLFWLFYSKFNSKIFKNIIIFFGVLYFTVVVYELLIKQIDYTSQSFLESYIIGGFSILIFVAYYLMVLLTSSKQENIYTNLLLWIAIAHFIYYLGFIPFKVGQNYFASFKEFHHLFGLLITITSLKSIILSIGFICTHQKVQS